MGYEFSISWDPRAAHVHLSLPLFQPARISSFLCTAVEGFLLDTTTWNTPVQGCTIADLQGPSRAATWDS